MASNIVDFVPGGRSQAFSLIHRAILERRPVTCRYRGHIREVCPHILGHTWRKEKVLVFQFGGGSSTGLPAGGEWRCFDLSEVTEIELGEPGPWHTGRRHSKNQHCVERVLIDVNEDMRSPPGRR